uniref:Uncharacterized protein n=1 Tax=Caenorhabditis tropicalis TaxID=1561998 RepID=A0A1I7USL5_9PELO
MDVNSSDQNGKAMINNSPDENKNELPPILRPKFPKRARRRRQNRKSRDSSASKDEDGDTDEKEDEKQKSPDKPYPERPSAESMDEGQRDHTKEREEPECRDSETNLATIEVQNSPTDVRNLPLPTIILETEKKKNSLEDAKKKDGGSRRKKKGGRRGMGKGIVIGSSNRMRI